MGENCCTLRSLKKRVFSKKKHAFPVFSMHLPSADPKNNFFGKNENPSFFQLPHSMLALGKKVEFSCFPFFLWKKQSVFKGKSMKLIFKIVVFVTISIHKSDVFQFFFFRKCTFALKRDAKKSFFQFFKNLLFANCFRNSLTKNTSFETFAWVQPFKTLFFSQTFFYQSNFALKRFLEIG